MTYQFPTYLMSDKTQPPEEVLLLLCQYGNEYAQSEENPLRRAWHPDNPLVIDLALFPRVTPKVLVPYIADAYYLNDLGLLRLKQLPPQGLWLEYDGDLVNYRAANGVFTTGTGLLIRDWNVLATEYRRFRDLHLVKSVWYLSGL